MPEGVLAGSPPEAAEARPPTGVEANTPPPMGLRPLTAAAGCRPTIVVEGGGQRREAGDAAAFEELVGFEEVLPAK